MARMDLNDDDRYIDDNAQMVDKLLDDIIISSIQEAESRGVSILYSLVVLILFLQKIKVE